MRPLFSFARFIPPLLLCLTLVTTTACSLTDREAPEEQINNPTPKLAVVVFATEDPNAVAPSATPLPTLPSTEVPPATPTPAATVGMGVSGGPASEPVEAVNADAFEKYVANRPPDVNPLTGQKVNEASLLERRPLMVRVGNDPIARPQLALDEADMVYEEITEWWITRFTAIYLSKDPAIVAPVRSARLINLMLVPQYQGALASSGGSDGVRWELSQSDIVDLDQLFVPGPYFHREGEGWQTRAAFDATLARDYLAEEGLESDVNLRGFLFSETLDERAMPAGVVSEAKEVIIPFPQQTSKATWSYDSGSGKYLRATTGEIHTDNNGNPLAAANVIIYFADHQATNIVEDVNGATSIRIVINGRGAAWLLRDGKIIKGNWETDGTETPLFVFDNGEVMPLKPGNTWVQVVPLEYKITVDGTEYSSQPGVAPAENLDAAPTAEATKPPPSPTSTPIGARPQATPEGE